MPLRRLAIHRIALALLVSCVALPSLSRADSLFGDDANTYAPPVDHSASRAAREELARARLLLTRARLASNQAQSTAIADARNDSGYRSLQSAAARAINEYQQARRPALLLLQRDSEYAKWSREREAARLELRRVAGNGTPDLGKLFPIAQRALAAGERITRTESIALALDPTVEEARIAMTDAFAMLRRTSMTIDERISNHPEAVTAAEEVALARQRVADANANLVAALKSEQEADRARRHPRNV